MTTPDFSPDQLFGAKLHIGGGTKKGNSFTSKATKELFKDKDLILLYFSASWCPPCQAFSPILIDFYKKYSTSLKFDIVYVSSDRTLNEFIDYYQKMPWLAIPTDAGSAEVKGALAKALQIRGIPALVVIDAKSGMFVTSNARDEIQRLKMDDASASKELVETWKSAERMTLEEGGKKSGGGGSMIMQLIFAILKNPMYIFAMLYFFKLAMRKFNELTGDEAPEPSGEL